MRLPTFVMLLCWPLVALAQSAGSDREPATHPATAMTFSLVEGEADACGPGCSRWIAAEGAILAATPMAFA